MAPAAARRLCALALCAAALGPGRAADPIPTDGTCSSSHYFDISALQCLKCPDGQEPHPSGKACVCAGENVPVSLGAAYDAEDESDEHCVPCPSRTVPPRSPIFATRVAETATCLACAAALDDKALAPPPFPPPLPPPSSPPIDANATAPPSPPPSPSASPDNATACVPGAGGALVSSLDPSLLRDGTLGECGGAGGAAADERCSVSDAVLPECACPPGMVAADTNAHGYPLASKVCERCAPNSFPDPSAGSVCVPCEDERMEWTEENGCSCPDGWSEVSHASGLWGREKTCVLTSARRHVEDTVDADVATTISYKHVGAVTGNNDGRVVTIDSATLQQLFLPAATECRIEVLTGRPIQPGVRSACQALANLCVLVDYDEGAPACRYFAELQSEVSGAVHGETEWRPSMPWLYYKDSVSALTDTTLELGIAVSPDASALGRGDSRLRFVLNSYSLNGTWLGLTNLTTELQLCGGPAVEGIAFADVGTHFTSACELGVDGELASLFDEIGGVHAPDSSVAARASPYRNSAPGLGAQLRGAFHELYVRDREERLFAVPVRVFNFDGQVNVNGDGTPWGSLPSVSDLSSRDDRLTRRFFLLDALSGREDGAERGEGPSVVRYAAELTIGVKVQELDASSIYPPVLSVRYAEAQPSAPSADGAEGSSAGAGSAAGARAQTVAVRFKSVYTMELTQYWQTVTMLVVFACVLVFFLFIFSSYVYMRRNQKMVLDGEFVCAAIVLLLRAYADVFVWLLLGLCAHWYVFFKGQASAFIMLPAEESTGPIVVMLVLCLAAKAVHVLSIVLQQSRADVFLIDWEGSHGTLLNKGGDGGEPAPVSTWRAIFAANELNELQARRFSSPALSLVLLLLLLEGADLNFYAKAMPGGAERSGAHVRSHVLLRFAVSSFCWGVVLLGQALALRLLWLPYVEDKVGQFVDLLSVANISALILPEQQCGYYLHGRSVHAHADASMLELNRQLRAEEDGVTSGRGLSPVSDVQTFEVFLTRGLRELYDQKFLQAAASAAAGAAAGGDPTGTGGLRRAGRGGGANPTNLQLRGLTLERARRAGDGFRANPEGAVLRYVEMNALLKDFIDANLGHHEYQIREKLYVERLFGLPPDMTFARDSLFLYDGAGGWTRALLYGREYDLALFEVLVFSVADLSMRSAFLAAAITYLVSVALSALRSALGQGNLARKTLIDDRFLI